MERKTRRGINPQTREELDIPARNVARFRTGRILEMEKNLILQLGK